MTNIFCLLIWNTVFAIGIKVESFVPIMKKNTLCCQPHQKWGIRYWTQAPASISVWPSRLACLKRDETSSISREVWQLLLCDGPVFSVKWSRTVTVINGHGYGHGHSFIERDEMKRDGHRQKMSPVNWSNVCPSIHWSMPVASEGMAKKFCRIGPRCARKTPSSPILKKYLK